MEECLGRFFIYMQRIEDEDCSWWKEVTEEEEEE
jgi:hypothetical protein